MADHEWLKALATAKVHNLSLTPEDPGAVQRLAAARIEEALTALREEAEVASSIHNQHARSERAIRVLPLAERQGGAFLLLRGRAQYTIGRDDKTPMHLACQLALLEGFAVRSLLLRRFYPQVDRFGTVLWSEPKGLLMDVELLVKRLFEDLSRAAEGL